MGGNADKYQVLSNSLTRVVYISLSCRVCSADAQYWDPTLNPTHDPMLDLTLDPTLNLTHDATLDLTLDPKENPYRGVVSRLLTY